MSATALINFTTVPEKDWGKHDRVPLSARKMTVNGRKLSPTGQKIIARISTFAPKTEDGKRKSCNVSHKKAASLGTSKRSLARNCKQLVDDGLIEQVDRKASGINYAMREKSKGRLYDVIPLYYHTLPVQEGDHKRTMRPSMVSALAHITTLSLKKQLLTACVNSRISRKGILYELTQEDKLKLIDETEFTCCYSVAQLAEDLNLTKNTVYKALQELEANEYIRIVYGKNKYKTKCKFTVTAKWLYTYLAYLKPRKSKASEAENANERSARDRFYALRKAKAEYSAEKALKKARKNARFVYLDREIRMMIPKQAKAEMYAPYELPALKERERDMRKERDKVLAEMDLTLDDLNPKYHCKKCEDTGTVKEGGGACTCYLHHLYSQE